MEHSVQIDVPLRPVTGGVKQWCLLNLARPASAQVFVPQIDGLRFIAIISVILYHVQGYAAGKWAVDTTGLWQRILAEGAFGVPLFFAISGYILARPFIARRGMPLRQYFTRRFTRLEPPYVICLLLVFAAKVLLLDVSFTELFPRLVASLLYSHNLIFGEHSAVNGVAWSLEIEWQFYLLVPLLGAFVTTSDHRIRHAVLLVLIALGGWAYASLAQLNPRVVLSLLGYFGFFIAGTWVALFDETHPPKVGGSSWLDLVGVLAWAGIIVALLDGHRFMAVVPALTALVLVCSLRGKLWTKVLGWWPVYCVGAMCYSVYLYHFFVLSALGGVFEHFVYGSVAKELLLPGFALIAIPAVLAVCALPYILIERPFMVWRPGRTRLIDAFRRPV